MQKCTKNGNEKCTTSRKPVMVTSSFRGGGFDNLKLTLFESKR
jgi:hypothetical protein